MAINGLPGMILGLTIARMFTSYIATKLQITGIEVKKITASQKGKKKDFATLREDLKRVSKDWGQWGQQALWKMGL